MFLFRRLNLRQVLFAASALASLPLASLGLTAASTPAAALFVCGQAGTGNSDGATAGFGAVACGSNASASGGASTATGGFSTASGSGSTATGNNSFASGSGSTATGVDSTASGIYSVASGFFGMASGDNSTATGGYSTASGASSTAYGQASAAGDSILLNTFQNAGTTAIGAEAQAGTTGAGQTNATALGYQAQANAANATALGSGAQANFANSTAIGQGAATTRANQVVIGTSSNTYTMPGVASAASLAAQSGPTSFVTTDAAGNLATSNINPSSIGALDGRVTNLESSVAQLQSNVAQLQRGLHKAYEVTAIALAMAGATLPEGKRYALSANWGTFQGENGFAASGIVRVSDNVFLNGGLGIGANRGTAGGRAGLTFAW